MKMNSIEKIIDLCDKYEDETLKLRRKTHENPELYHKEYQTSRMVETYLLKYSSEIYKGLNVENPKEYILKDAKPIMASEDFGFFSEVIPSLYYMVGRGDNGPGHSSKFFVDEKWIKICTRTMTIASIKYLEE